jgi:hypothetical protein
VIRVARNDPAALETARQNVERNPDAPAAQLAYSYALQAARQLPPPSKPPAEPPP